jgi:ferredoxin-type protein NapF
MQFLRGDIQGKHKPFRPPWAVPEPYFTDFCTRCDQCIEACFDELIVKGRGGYPQMDFTQGGCDFCADCLNACEASALKQIPDEQACSEAPEDKKPLQAQYLPPWYLKAKIDLENCLSMNGTICRSCGESCDHSAIRYDIRLGGVAEPMLNAAGCNGCGACISVCPTQVISLYNNKELT